jgi:hypothetical protein
MDLVIFLARASRRRYVWWNILNSPKEVQLMEDVSSQVLPTVHHLRFLIFDWSLPNVIMGVIVIALFFLGAWARLPKWIERGRERAKGGKK